MATTYSDDPVYAGTAAQKRDAVVVIFSAPGVPQDRILERTDFGAGMDPFATINTVNWDYGEAFDRRGFFVPSP